MNIRKKLFCVLAIGMMAATSVSAQGFTTDVDFYSSYVWRGSKAGAFSVQPTIKYVTGGFTVGAWGSYDLTTGSPEEADLYASYSTDFGLSIGVTDYHYNTSKLFDSNNHAFEANLGYSIGSFSLSGNYIFNTASGAAGDDKYFEASYAFPKVKLFAGAGDGWYTSDASFKVCNVGISTSKEIKITDSFSLPLSGSVIVNPDKEQIFFVVGISL